MAVHHTQPLLVTSGLIYYMDAANVKTYVGTGTVCSDLSGNQNTTALINGSSFSSANAGSFVFNGVNQYIGNTTPVNTGQNFTVGVWMYASVLGAGRRALIANSYPWAGNQGWLFSTSGFSVNNTFMMDLGQDQAYRVAAANTITPNVWNYLSATVQNGGSAITLYVNGQSVSTYSFTSQVTVPLQYTYSQFNIGARDVPTSAEYFTGNIASAHIYNRVLSAAEILQNFNAGRGRFGL